MSVDLGRRRDPERFRSLDTARSWSSPGFGPIPIPCCDRLRAHERVHHANIGATLVSGYDEALAVLKDAIIFRGLEALPVLWS